MSARQAEKSAEKRKQLDDPAEHEEEMEAESASDEEESSSSDESVDDEEMEQLEAEFEAFTPLPCDKEGKTERERVAFAMSTDC